MARDFKPDDSPEPTDGDVKGALGEFGISEADLDAISVDDEPAAAPAQSAPAPAPKAQDGAEPPSPASTGESPEPTGEPAPAKPTGEAPPDATQAQPPEQAPEAGEAFAFTADGRKVDVPGAYVEKDRNWVRIPVKAWTEHVQPHLADRGAIRQRFEAMGRQLKQVTEQQGVRETQAESLLKRFDEIITLADTDPTKSLDKWEELLKEWPQTRLQHERDYWLQRATQPDAARQAEARQAIQRELEEQVRSSFGGYVDDVLKLDEYKDLAPVKDRLVKVLYRHRHELVVDTGEMVPGTQIPRLDVNWLLFKELVDEEASLHRGHREQLSKIEAAAKKNAVRDAPRPTLPPAAPASGTPSGGQSAKAPDSWEETLAQASQLE